MVKNLNELAREIIKTNQYLTIASSDKKGSPWASAVVYSYDKDWNLYFLSIPSSNHCQNIKNREKVVVAIFDSHQLFGQGVGLQIEGEAVEVNTRDTGGSIKIFFERKFLYGGPSHSSKDYIKQFTSKESVYRCYKIVPKRVWMNDPNNKVDTRVVVKL